MKKKSQYRQQNAKYILEELEPRQLFSGGIEGLVVSQVDSPAATYLDVDTSSEQPSVQLTEVTTSSAAEQQTHEIVFVDTGLENYQALVDDLISNSDTSRSIEVVLLDSDSNGIDQISETLKTQTGLDAVHIISHGSDGSVQLGNTSLNADNLTQNKLNIALWANAFSESGDILIYGCNLAASEVGQSLINQLSELTLADVAASSDLTGHASFGGDWELERSAGSIEATVAISAEAQGQWTEMLADYNETNWSGTQTYVDGATSFDLSLTGGGTIDWNYVGATDTLTISTNGSGGSTNLSITNIVGALTIDTITVSGSPGTITVSGDTTRIDNLIFNSEISDDTITINGDVGTLTLNDRFRDSTMLITGDLDSVWADEWDGNVNFTAENVIGPFDMTGDYTYSNNFAVATQVDFDGSSDPTETPSNQPPVIGGDDIGALTEDVGVVGGNISDSGILTIADPDPGESSFQAATINGTYGDLTIDTTGNWSYSAVNSQAAIQALDVGETLVEVLTVTTFDGSTQVVTITINGAEDAAVIGGTAVGTVAEDGSLIASNALTITDVDSSDNPISFNDVVPTLGDNGYGNFEITGNSWTFTLDNTNAAVQALDVTESLTDTFTFTATDGSTQVVIVTITGTEDAPTVDNAIGDQVAIENAAFSFTVAANTFGDLDTSDALTYTATLADNSALPAWLTFNPGTLNFSGTPATADLGPIDVKVSADDGSSTITDTFQISVNNAVSPAVVPPVVNPVSNPNPGGTTGQENTPPQIIESLTGGGNGEEIIQPENSEIISTVAGEQISNVESLIDSLVSQTDATQVDDNPGTKSGKFNNIPANQQQALQDQLSNQTKLGSLLDADNNLVDEHESKLWKQMNAMNRQMSDDASRDEAQEIEAQIVIGSTFSLTAGFVGWALRGGSLLASIMSSVSVLSGFDPLPILKKSRDKENVTADDDDNTESKDDTNIVSKDDSDPDSDSAKKLDELFTSEKSR